MQKEEEEAEEESLFTTNNNGRLPVKSTVHLYAGCTEKKRKKERKHT